MTGEGRGAGSEFTAGVERGVDAGVNASADDGSEFTAAGVDDDAVDFGAVIGSIMAEIGGDGAGTEVGFDVDVGVADIAEVSNGGPGSKDGIFHFDGLADVAVVADGGGAAEVAVGANLTVFADDDVTFDEDTGKNLAAFADDDAGVVTQLDGGVAGPVGDGGDDLGVDVEEVPRVGGGEGAVEEGFPFGEGLAGDVELGFVGGERPHEI